MLHEILPYVLYRPLFGDRRRFGTVVDVTDRDYLRWQTNMERFYLDNQKGTIGSIVNNWGFRIISKTDFTARTVLEIGPGFIEHYRYWRGIPDRYLLVDTREVFLLKSADIIRRAGVADVATLITDGTTIPCDAESVDIVVTFHQLEHVLQLEPFLGEIARVLKRGGLLVGAVPCEGGMAWGLGRFMTSRRYVKKYMDFDYDKIICWEHPHFVDAIKRALDGKFMLLQSMKRPFMALPFDLNLSWSFVYRNDKP